MSRMRCGSRSPTATASRGKLSVTPSSTSRRCSRPCSLTTIFRSSFPLAALFAAALVLLTLWGCDAQPKFKSTDITGADYGKVLDLTDHTGKPRHLADFRGK